MFSKLHTASEILCAAVALPIVRMWFDYPISFTQWVWDQCFLHTSHDGRSLWRNVHRTSLGDGTISVQIPLNENGRPRENVKGFIVYIPGGGFAATAFYQYSSSTTPFVRRGFVVFGIDYEKSSAMSATASAPGKVREIVQKVLEHVVPAWPDVLQLGVHVMGDSAGANLALLSGLALSSRKVRRALGGGLEEFSAPPVHSICAISGMMARVADLPEHDAATIPFVIRHALGFLWRAHLGELALPRLLGFVVEDGFSSSSHPLSRALAKGAFASVLHDVKQNDLILNFPPVLLCCGTADFLVTHSMLVKRQMDELGLPCELELYEDAPHAFYAIPCEWTFGFCYRSSVPCARDILCFLLDCQPDEEGYGGKIDVYQRSQSNRGGSGGNEGSKRKRSKSKTKGKGKGKGTNDGEGEGGAEEIENQERKEKAGKRKRTKMPLSQFVTGKRDMPLTAPTAWIVASEIVILMPITIVLCIAASALTVIFVIKSSVDLAVGLVVQALVAAAIFYTLQALIAPLHGR